MLRWFRGRKINTAKNIVKGWEKSQASHIAEELVRVIPGQIPFLREVAGSALAAAIQKNLVFSASEPEAVSGNIYHVTDTARVNLGVGIPFIAKQFSVSINYGIRVDVKAKKVVESKPEITSLKIDFG